MSNSMQYTKLMTRLLSVIVIAAFTAGCEESELATQQTDSISRLNPAIDGGRQTLDTVLVADSGSSDSNIAAQNWDEPGGPHPDAVQPGHDTGMIAEKWRSLEQPVVLYSNLAAQNWNDVNGSHPHAVAPSGTEGMAAETWKE